MGQPVEVRVFSTAPKKPASAGFFFLFSIFREFCYFFDVLPSSFVGLFTTKLRCLAFGHAMRVPVLQIEISLQPNASLEHKRNVITFY
ncbi:hypothetical protein AGR1A_Cc40248 [Agrobacterium fabacearum CFBP 5771]|nr:hypothetical protein AGR1A_Cc40248 [Agrobacterium fabacearum CFBP 5771]